MYKMIRITGTTWNWFNTSCFFFKTQNYLLANFYFKNGTCWQILFKQNTDQLNFNNSFCKIALAKKYYQVLNLEYKYLFFWKRLTFRGKSYRIRYYTRLKKFTFNFNFSHWAKVKMSNTWLVSRRRRKKDRDRQRYIITTYKGHLLNTFVQNFKNIRHYNCYTMRGLRFRTQPIIRRFGKISQHVSILH